MKKYALLCLAAFLVLCASSFVYADGLCGMISRMDGNVGIISITKDKGIEPGMILYVYRAAEFVGRAQVGEVGSINSKVMALPECSGLKVGDAVLSRPAPEVYMPLPPYGRSVCPNFILRETDGRAIVAGKIDRTNLDQVREEYNLGAMFVEIQNIENAEDFWMPLSRTGNFFLELPPGTYVIENVHIMAISGVSYNAWGIPLGIIPGFMMKKGGKVFPFSYKFEVPEKANVVYIGTLKTNINPKDPYTKVYKELPTYTSVVDEYDASMAELKKLNPFIRKIGSLADTDLEIKAQKKLMELVPAGPGSLFLARNDWQTARNELLDSINYYEAPYRAEAHNVMAGVYWDKECWCKALMHYDFARKLGYPVPEDRMKILEKYRKLTRMSIE